MAHNSQNNFIFHFTFYIFHFSLVKVGLLVELIVLILPMAHNSQQKPPRLDLTNNSTQLNTIALIFGRYMSGSNSVMFTSDFYQLISENDFYIDRTQHCTQSTRRCCPYEVFASTSFWISACSLT